MEMTIYAKANIEVLEKQPEFIKKVIARELKSKLKRKGGVKVFRKGNMELSRYDGDNFAHNRITVIQRYDVFKKPRFIK